MWRPYSAARDAVVKFFQEGMTSKRIFKGNVRGNSLRKSLEDKSILFFFLELNLPKITEVAYYQNGRYEDFGQAKCHLFPEDR